MALLDALHDLVKIAEDALTDVKNEMARLENDAQGVDIAEAQEAAKTSATNTAATTTVDEPGEPVGSTLDVSGEATNGLPEAAPEATVGESTSVAEPGDTTPPETVPATGDVEDPSAAENESTEEAPTTPPTDETEPVAPVAGA